MINPRVLASNEATSSGLRQPFYVIQDALIPSIAEQLYCDLLNVTLWGKDGEQRSKEATARVAAVKQDVDYKYSRNFIDLESNDAPASIRDFNTYLNSAEVLAWVSAISGRQCDFFHGKASLFTSGDNISRHNDHYALKTDDNRIITRAVTFNYYLTKQWNEEWGGTFVWEKPHSVLVPSFNTLVMFLVGPGSMHHVEPVVSENKIKRLAITGWFHSSKDADLYSSALNLDFINA